MGGKFHLKLNTCERPIANKYREGKVKRTLKRESKVLEIANSQAIETSEWTRHVSELLLWFGFVSESKVRIGLWCAKRQCGR